MICENQKRKVITVVASIFIISLLLCRTGLYTKEKSIPQETVDLSRIKERESLVVATSYNSVDYFVYRGEPMGFQYELLNELSKYLGIKIEVVVGKSFTDNLQSLSEGRCDMIASGLVMSGDTLMAVNCNPLYTERQVLVQRKPAKWKKMTEEELNQSMVRHPGDLNGKMVYTSGWSPLTEGKDFVPGRHIRFTQLNGIKSEGLVDLVAEGELDYAICSWSVARLLAGRYPHIDIQTELGEWPVGWIARPSSVELIGEINEWLAEFKKTAAYAILYKKYHESKTQQRNANTKLFAVRTGIISEYDSLFKKYSREIGWDWRLLASLVCQESRFDPTAYSKKGAYGLMQMMPATLKSFGADSTSSPEKHIAAGVAYIKYLDRMLAPSVADKKERIKFVLASYNIGPGHILDAQRLAGKYGKDATVWDNNVDSCLLSKGDPKFYTDPEVRHGKCTGRETFAFVAQIMERYGHYKNIGRIR
jgi:membrane-bound lytic murein transglycosylase F